MKKLTLLLVGLIVFSAPFPAQVYLYSSRFHDRLSNPDVTCLAESADGQIWIGTRLGLNCYNGSTYRSYFQESGGLADDNILSLLAKPNGDVWVGASSGISLIRGMEPVANFPVPSSRISGLAETDGDKILFSSIGGLYTLDIHDGTVSKVYSDSRLEYSALQVTADGFIWLHDTASGEVTVLSRNYSVLSHILPGGHTVHSICKGMRSDVYICTSNGIQRYISDGTPSQATNISRASRGKDVLFLASRGSTWLMGVKGSGIFRVDSNGSSQEWEYESLTDVESCGFLLTESNLWLSKNGKGLVNLFRNNDNRLINVPLTGGGDMLRTFYALDNDNMLIVTNKGLFIQDLATRKWTELEGGGLDGMKPIGLSVLTPDRKLWLQYDYTSLRQYSLDGNRLRLLKTYGIEPSGALWADSQGGVRLLQSDHISVFGPGGEEEKIPTAPHPKVTGCVSLGSGESLFIAEGGIWRMDNGQNLTKCDLAVPEVSCLYVDENGIWWIGTKHSGIFRYNPEDGDMAELSYLKDGGDKSIRSIVGDGNGTIWASTRYDFIRLTEDGAKSYIYSSPDPNRYMNFAGTAAVTDNGTVVFGTRNRLVTFNKKTIFPWEGRLPLFLDYLLVNNSGAEPVGDKPLILKSGSSSLSFYFSCRNFNPAVVPVCQYKLEGYDKDWVDAGQSLRAGYSGLKSGKYTFRVRVKQQNGEWSSMELSRELRIKPYLLLSWPAKTLYALIVLYLGFLFIRQLVRIRLDKEKLERVEHEKLLMEQTAQERLSFFTNVSHEFRTPLSLIYGPIKELGKSEALSDRDKRLVGIVERNAGRMISLTDGLLDFNRSSAKADRLSVRKADISAFMKTTLANFEYIFKQKNLTLSTDLPQGLYAYCDKEKLGRIVFNLLSNAVKYTPEYGEISVSTCITEGMAAISVADTGIGVQQDKIEQIFKRFSRLEQQVDGSVPVGFGIGLNYSQQLARLHKGEISIRANEPVGSVFSFSFPCGKEAYPDAAVWSDERDEAKGTGDSFITASAGSTEDISILIVEDNDDMRAYLGDSFRKGYHVSLAANGEEAMRLIRLSLPDIIISDVMMPFKDGYSLCKELKSNEEYWHIPIILLTAKADMESRIHGMDLGADGYVAKPFETDCLLSMVRGMIENRRKVQRALSDKTSNSMDSVRDKDLLSGHDKAFFAKCCQLMDAHLADEEFGVLEMSVALGMSRTSVYSKLKQLTGDSPKNFITNYRLNRAMEMLKARTANVSETAYTVGFSTLTGFSRSFKTKFGIPPSAV